MRLRFRSAAEGKIQRRHLSNNILNIIAEISKRTKHVYIHKSELINLLYSFNENENKIRHIF